MSRPLRRDGHPLGVRRELIDEPEEVTAEASSRKWHFGVAAGALLVAGTFAAGALGLNGGSVPFAGSAPEHAPAAPGNGPNEVVPPPAQAPPPAEEGGDREQPVDPESTQPASTAPNGQNAPVQEAPAPGGGGTGGGGSGGGAPAPAPAPDPAPQPDPQPQPQPQPDPGGGGGGLLDPITGAVGGVLDPITGAVGGILSPNSASTTAAPASGAGDQPAMTMIDPLGDLLGG